VVQPQNVIALKSVESERKWYLNINRYLNVFGIFDYFLLYTKNRKFFENVVAENVKFSGL